MSNGDAEHPSNLAPSLLGGTVTAVPMLLLVGKLQRKNASLQEAKSALTETTSSYLPLVLPEQQGPYYTLFVQGASIFPQSLWFAAPPVQALVVDAQRPHLETDPSIESDAKPPWKGLRIRGAVERQFVYGTMLSENLLPFRVRRLRMAVLPLLREEQVLGDTRTITSRVLTSDGASERGYVGLAGWMAQAEKLWETHKKNTTKATVDEWVDYQGKLSRQEPERGFKVLYNTSGTYLAACVLDATQSLVVAGVRLGGFVVHSDMYSFTTDDPREAYYLAASLNAPSIDEAIKPYQPRGLFGATHGGGQRHIHRRPFELAPLPRFDPSNPRHIRLAELGRECHRLAAELDVPDSQRVGLARRSVREALHAPLSEIDALVKAVAQDVDAAETPPQAAMQPKLDDSQYS